MPQVEEPTSFEPRSPSAEARKPKAPTVEAETAAPSPDLVALTVDATTGRVVKIEGVDGAGARHELSADTKARLAKTEAGATLQGVVEEAFEAGIACALGEPGEAEAAESDEDAELSRMLLRSLIERSRAKRFLQREVLGQAVVGALVRQAAASGAAPPDVAAH